MIHSPIKKTSVKTDTEQFSYTKIEGKYTTKNTTSYLINYTVNNKKNSVELHCIAVNLSNQVKLRGENVISNIISASIVCQKFMVVVVGSLFTNTINIAPTSELENYITTVVLKELNVKPNLLLLRDFVPETVFESGNKYKYILNDVIMNFEVNTTWLTINDYCAALSKKYKTRALKTLEAIKELVVVELSLIEIKTNENKITSLLNQVVNKQELSIIEHQHDYFYQLKNSLGDNLKFLVFKNSANELLAFMPIILHDATHCEVHYIGYDAKHNATYKLYQNILLQAVQFGINNKMQAINFGHTSLEAKAILGAKPTVVSHAYKTKGIIAKCMINQIVNHIDTAYNAEWKERNPFK